MDIFVKNFPFNTTEEELKTLFEEFGTVSSVKIITDRLTGKSRGFGFVEVEFTANPEEAIQALNGKKIDDRAILVKKSEPRPDKGRRPMGGGGGGRKPFNNRRREGYRA